MFIKNFSSISKHSVILVDNITKDYLQSLGYSPLSSTDESWAFLKSDELINILKTEKGGKDFE